MRGSNILLVIALLALTGCPSRWDPFAEEVKCVNGVLYGHDKGAWIQMLTYKDNKCLPEENK